MATLLDDYYPFATGPGSNVTEAQWRRLFGNCKAGQTGIVRGVASEFRVIQRAAGANMSVDVGGGECRIQGHLGHTAGGVSALNVPISANAAGNPRIDRIVLGADYSAKTISIYAIEGTPAASPTAPALTQNTALWEISLAQIAVANGASSIVTANITDERRWANAMRWGLKWGISGVQATPSGAANYLIPALFELELGWSAVVDNAYGAIRGGTSATYKFQKSSTIAGALSDVTGLTSLSATTTPARTALTAGGSEVAIVDQAMVAPVLTAVSASPDNLGVGIGGWKYPTPLVTT